MKILHISDVHLEKSIDQSLVIDAFLADLKKTGPYDVTIFTGDLGLKGNLTNEIQELAIGSIFSKIKEQMGKNHPIILCPGNHDVDIKSIKSYIKPNFDLIKNPKDANNLIAQSDETALWSHLENFNNISDKICPPSIISNQLFKTYKINTDIGEIGVAALNSTWRTQGGGQQDYGYLYFGENQIRIAAASIKDCKLKIAAFHHSIEWFNVSEQPAIRRALSQEFDAILYGHNHDNLSVGIVSPNNNMLSAQCGSLYQSREYFNGYLAIKFSHEKGEWTVNAREYYNERNCFDIVSVRPSHLASTSSI